MFSAKSGTECSRLSRNSLVHNLSLTSAYNSIWARRADCVNYPHMRSTYRWTAPSLVLILAATICLPPRTWASAYDGHPKLVVVIVIDQFRGDYLDRYHDKFGDSGFRLLIDHGAYFPNCNYNYANTRTAPGHSTLFTGAYSEVHFKLPTSVSSLLLPVDTLLFRSEGLRVATVGEGQRVDLKPIIIGHDFGNQVEILSGLTGDDTVIVNPPDSVVAGQVVRIAQSGGNQGAQ